MLGDSLRRRWGVNLQTGARRPAPAWQVRVQWTLIAVVAALASFGTGYALAVYVIFPAPEAAGSGEPVPDLVGRPLAEAERELTARGLRVGEVMELPHPGEPKGVVVAQSPLAGQWLRPGATVRVAVSAGSPRIRIPEVAGLTAQTAMAMLQRTGLQVRRRRERASVEEGRAVRTEPGAGTVVELPAHITLVVSAGPPPPPLFPEEDEPSVDDMGIEPLDGGERPLEESEEH